MAYRQLRRTTICNVKLHETRDVVSRLIRSGFSPIHFRGLASETHVFNLYLANCVQQPYISLPETIRCPKPFYGTLYASFRKARLSV